MSRVSESLGGLLCTARRVMSASRFSLDGIVLSLRKHNQLGLMHCGAKYEQNTEPVVHADRVKKRAILKKLVLAQGELSMPIF